jgi:hypothetical protein
VGSDNKIAAIDGGCGSWPEIAVFPNENAENRSMVLGLEGAGNTTFLLDRLFSHNVCV